MEQLHDASGEKAGSARGVRGECYTLLFQRGKMKRGRTVFVRDLPKQMREQFARAIELAGAGSQAKWISTQIRLFIREQQEKFGADLFAVLTADEQQVLDVIRSGAAELAHIVEESLLPPSRVAQILDNLERRKRIEARRKGGKTEGARGAATTLYIALD